MKNCVRNFKSLLMFWMKWVNTWKSKKKIGKTFIKHRGKYILTTGTLAVYNCFSLTEFPPCFLFQVEFIPPPVGEGQRFRPKYLPLPKIHKPPLNLAIKEQNWSKRTKLNTNIWKQQMSVEEKIFKRILKSIQRPYLGKSLNRTWDGIHYDIHSSMRQKCWCNVDCSHH